MAQIKRAAEDDFEAGSGMRANIDELIEKRRSVIDELRRSVGENLLSVSPEYDDIFLLRFILTWEKRGGLSKAVGAVCDKVMPGQADQAALNEAFQISLLETGNSVRETIKFRQDNKAALDEACRPGGLAPHEEICNKFQTVGAGGSLGGLEPIYVVRTGHSNIKALMHTLSVEQVSEWLHYTKERNYRLCDQLTRKTRMLIKVITVVDMTNFSMFGGDRSFYKALGDSSQRASINYPQLLGKSVLINTPSFFRAIFSSFSIFMPQSFIDKITVCPASGTDKPGAQNASVCPFVQKWCKGDLGTIVDIHGGTMKTPGYLLPREGLNSDLIKIHLANRSSKSVDIMVPTDGLKAKWEVIVENFGVGMGAVLFPEDGSPQVTVMPDTKIKAEGGLAQGDLYIPKKGKLVITFDNSYSILRSKTFEYKINLHEDDHLSKMAPMTNASMPPMPSQVDALAEKVRQVVHM